MDGPDELLQDIVETTKEDKIIQDIVENTKEDKIIQDIVETMEVTDEVKQGVLETIKANFPKMNPSDVELLCKQHIKSYLLNIKYLEEEKKKYLEEMNKKYLEEMNKKFQENINI